VRQQKGLAYAGLIIVSAIWGLNFGISRWAMEYFDPSLFVFLRFVGAVPLLFLLLYWKEGGIRVSRKDMLLLVVIGLVGVTALEVLVMYSIKFTTLANASLLNVAPWPIFTALFASLFTREPLTRHLMIGGALAMVGVSLVILGGGEGFQLRYDQLAGDLLALGVSIIGALFNLACMPLMRRYSPLRVSTWYILFGTIGLIPFTLGKWSEVAWPALGVIGWSALLYNVLLCTVFAFVVWNGSMKIVGATRANFFRYVVPAAAILTGYLFYQEAMTVWQLLGGVLMAGGLVWISMERSAVTKEQITPDLA
jgi:drug/metabolite transporter (DMT)-like permease